MWIFSILFDEMELTRYNVMQSSKFALRAVHSSFLHPPLGNPTHPLKDRPAKVRDAAATKRDHKEIERLRTYDVAQYLKKRRGRAVGK